MPHPNSNRTAGCFYLFQKVPNRGLTDKVSVTVHRYGWLRNLGPTLGLLNFQKYHIEELISAGYTDAQKHDCKESQCLLPTGNPTDYQP